jgi:hypothetical protein
MIYLLNIVLVFFQQGHSKGEAVSQNSHFRKITSSASITFSRVQGCLCFEAIVVRALRSGSDPAGSTIFRAHV